MACPIPTIPIAVVLDMMKNKKNKSWKYLESREGYFGHLVTIFVINFVGYKEGKLVEEGSAGIANDPKASTSEVSTCEGIHDLLYDWCSYYGLCGN